MASSRLRLGWKNEMKKNSREVVLRTSGGSRLLSFLSHHRRQRGMVIFLHGWEGSSSSVYILESANYFYRLGSLPSDVLNLRDHGDSHHLNEGLFHGALLQETFEGVEHLSAFSAGTPVYLVGFSLGGNFALRIAMRHGIKPIPNLKHVLPSVRRWTLTRRLWPSITAIPSTGNIF